MKSIDKLKQIIKEEIQKVLNEDHKPGDKVIYGGLGTVTINKEENGLIYFTDSKGNKYKKNYNQFKQSTKPFQSPIYNPLHEDEARENRMYIRGIDNIISRLGTKAQDVVTKYLQGRKLVDLSNEELMKLSILLNNKFSKPSTSPTSTDPSILGKGKGHLGSTYTGD